MIVLRQNHYSKRDDEIEDNSKKLLGAGGLIIGGHDAAILHNNWIAKAVENDKMNQRILHNEEEYKLLENLKKVGEKDGINMNVSPLVKSGFYEYTPRRDGKHINESIHSGYYVGTLAHELGHSKHYNGREGSKLGKLLHKTADKMAKTDEILKKHKLPKLEPAAAVGTGLISGYRAGKDKEKDSVLNKLAPGAVVIMTRTPQVGQEISATREGYKLLKKAGASKEYLKGYKKNLGLSATSYTSNALSLLGLAYGSRLVGKVVGSEVSRMKERKKKKDK